MSYVLGWDLGGAHLKAALLDTQGRIVRVMQEPCPLWQGMQVLEAATTAVLQRVSQPVQQHVVTMTGEMADFFADRHEGVLALSDFMQRRLAPVGVQLYAGKAGFVPVAAAAGHSQSIASANWLATAQWLAQQLDDAVLIDIGSTTADLIPMATGRLIQRGHDDATRLRDGELVYTGVVRTSLMALAQQAPVNGDWLGVMAEHFATTADIYRVLQWLPDGADQHPTADGADKTVAASRRRLARMVGMDDAELPDACWVNLARYFSEQQLLTLSRALLAILSRREFSRPPVLAAAGCGRFLVTALAQRLGLTCIDFNSLLPLQSDGVPGHSAADCAPAFAVAALWLDSLQDNSK